MIKTIKLLNIINNFMIRENIKTIHFFYIFINYNSYDLWDYYYITKKYLFYITKTSILF
jgi:hypothetical protein